MKYLITSRNAATLACSAVIMIAVSQRVTAQSAAQPPHTGLVNSAGAAFNPLSAKAYIVDSTAGVVHISNDRDGTARTVKVGANPTSVAVDTANGRVYVVNAGDGTVSVLDPQTDGVLATLPVGAHPYSIAADSAGGRIYVTRTYSDQLMVIDAATNKVSSIKAGSPDLLIVNEKTHTVYLLSYEMGDLAILDAATLRITRTSVGMHAWGLAFNPVTGTLYTAKPGDGTVAVFAPGSTAPIFIPVGGMPCAIAVNTQTNTVYAADYTGNRVVAIDATLARVVANIPVGNRPEAVVVDADNNRIYAANTISGDISVIDGTTNKVIATQPVSSAPYALAIDPARSRLHVAMVGDQLYRKSALNP